MAKTLLLADDSVTIQKVVGISFASEDITIKTVDNGDAALAKARELRPDIILADVVMPGLTGYEVCEAIKADPELAHIPVLLLTGTFEAFDEERASRAGAAGHVAKPFEAQTLVECVKQLIAQAPPPRLAPAPTPIAAPKPMQRVETRDPEQSFDFFDEPAVASATARPELVASSMDFDVEGPDGAFAFGEDELPDASDFSVADRSSASIAHTVAILPDTTVDSDLDADLPPPVPEATESDTDDFGDEGGYDFEFEGVQSRPSSSAEFDVLADSAQLDPGTSAFDVSSSDLGDLEELSQSAIQPVAATQILSEALDDDDEGEISSPHMLAPDPMAPGFHDEASDPLDDDPIETGPIASSAAFIEDLPTQAPSRAIDFGAAAAMPIAADDAPDLWPVEAETVPPGGQLPSSREVEFADPDSISDFDRVPLAASREPESRSVQAMTDDALEQIAPVLRAQIHETLEKIAWEAFGQVAETVVQQAVEQVEKIAWEVVPKLAETLILEELRKLKGE